MAQVDDIHIDIWIPPALQKTISPILNVDIRFLVQFTNGGGRYFATTEGLSNALQTPDGYACRVYLNESRFHATLPAAVPLNNGGLKRDPLEFGHLAGDVSRSSMRLRL